MSPRAYRILRAQQRSLVRLHATGESVWRSHGVIDRATIRDYYSPLEFVRRWGVLR